MREATRTEVQMFLSELFHQRTFGQKRRVLKSPEDWGDQETIGCFVKRRGSTSSSPGDHFGLYLGQHPEGYVIGYFADDSTTIAGGFVFESIEEMKIQWWID